jgi:hypothetical protein
MFRFPVSKGNLRSSTVGVLGRRLVSHFPLSNGSMRNPQSYYDETATLWKSGNQKPASINTRSLSKKNRM